MNNKVAIYIRVSTQDQTPENQKNPLIEYCNREGLEYEIFEEFASGAKESRPELDKMMQGIRAGKFNKVLVWKLDRLGRSLQHLLLLISEFKNKKIGFISLTEGFDTTTPQGKLFFSIAGAFAEFERQLIVERVKAGLERAKKSGVKLGRRKGSKDKKRRRTSGYVNRWLKDGNK